MKEFLRSPQIFQLSALIGFLIALGGTVITALFYRGKENESFSILNHYSSELGEVGVSKLAWVYNISMILTGLILVFACISLGLVMPGLAPKIGIDFGVFYGLCLSMTGLIPMNKPRFHGQTVIAHFRIGLVTIAIFSLGIVIQPAAEIIISRWYALAGLPVIITNVIFMIMAPQLSQADNPIYFERQVFKRSSGHTLSHCFPGHPHLAGKDRLHGPSGHG